MILFLIYLICTLIMMHCRYFIEHIWLSCQNWEVRTLGLVVESRNVNIPALIFTDLVSHIRMFRIY